MLRSLLTIACLSFGFCAGLGVETARADDATFSDPLAAPNAAQQRQVPQRVAPATPGQHVRPAQTPAPRPSATGPHPKLVMLSPVAKAPPTWSTEKADFEWRIANRGEAPLDIRLRGG